MSGDAISNRVASLLREPQVKRARPPSKIFTIIGVTGGMASGKSTAARMIARDQFPHVDADALVHDLMARDPETIAALTYAFPKAVTQHGAIDRRALARIVAEDAGAIATLEAILHPRVRAAEQAAIAQARTAEKRSVVLDVPLLFETGADALCDVVVAVCAPTELRKQRAFTRPGMTSEKWDRLTARQLTDEARAARAHHVIDTSGSEAETAAQVDALIKQWGLV